jgi:ribosomal protein S16
LQLGTYDPLPAALDGTKEVRLDVARLKYWLGVGAQPSERVAYLLWRAGLLPAPPIRFTPGKWTTKEEGGGEASGKDGTKGGGGGGGAGGGGAKAAAPAAAAGKKKFSTLTDAVLAEISRRGNNSGSVRGSGRSRSGLVGLAGGAGRVGGGGLFGALLRR